MPRLVGTARSITDARRAVAAIAGTCALLAAFPACLLEVVLPALVEAVRIEKYETARASQSWHDMYGNNHSLDFEIEMEFNPMFRSTFRMRREHFQELRSKLGIPLTMTTRCRKKFTGTTGLLVLLARMGSPATLETLGKVLKMNPKRISAISNTMVRWMHARWGHVILGGLIESRLPLCLHLHTSSVHQLVPPRASSVHRFPPFGQPYAMRCWPAGLGADPPKCPFALELEGRSSLTEPSTEFALPADPGVTGGGRCRPDAPPVRKRFIDLFWM